MADTLSYPVVDDVLLAEVVRRILSVESPKKIVLFGSHARGDAHEGSDLDLLVIEDSRELRSRRAARYYVALNGLFPETDIVVWSPSEVSEWASVPDHFISTALREGRTLHEHSF